MFQLRIHLYLAAKMRSAQISFLAAVISKNVFHDGVDKFSKSLIFSKIVQGRIFYSFPEMFM